jgi:hypothetical protein
MKQGLFGFGRKKHDSKLDTQFADRRTETTASNRIIAGRMEKLVTFVGL